MSKTKLSRREFLQQAALASGAVPLGGISPTATLAGQAEPKLGAQFIGKLEGPEIIRDVAKFPKKFAEAPMLAERVKAGKLPPVDKRLPDSEDLMVIKSLKEVGKYGGRWRRGFTGPADTENGNRIVSTDKIRMWDYTGNKVAPCLVKDWRLSDDGCSARAPVPACSETEEDLWVEADPERLAMVVEHVIRNAQDATPAEGTVTVSVGFDAGAAAASGAVEGDVSGATATPVGDSNSRLRVPTAALTVTDTGPG